MVASKFQGYGKVDSRTRYTLNEICIEGNTAKLKLYNRECQETAETIIDIEDIGKVNKYKWSLSGNGYVINHKLGYLHHLIIGFPQKGHEVDHISRNILDNRKENLRFATRGQSNANSHQKSKCGKPTSSAYKGVYRDKSREKWCCEITKSKKKLHVGRFDTEIEAAKQYDIEAIRLFGRFALTNKMLELL